MPPMKEHTPNHGPEECCGCVLYIGPVLQEHSRMIDENSQLKLENIRLLDGFLKEKVVEQCNRLEAENAKLRAALEKIAYGSKDPIRASHPSEELEYVRRVAGEALNG